MTRQNFLDLRLPERASVSDATIVAVAIAEVLGARWAVSIPLWIVGVAVVVALVWRRPILIVAVGLILASSLASRSWAGLRPVDPEPVVGRVTLVSDPVRTSGAVRAEVRWDGHRYDLWARGRTGFLLEDRAAGERVNLRGHTTSVQLNSWRASRHLKGRIVVDDVIGWSPGGPVSRLANGLRRTLMRGAEVLPHDLKPLFGGFVLGDTRGQDPLMADDFREAGLTHLLVVSGSNVAFVLVVAAPILLRLGLRPRLIATVALLFFFAVLTRMEPSVLRATVMAGMTATATTIGRPQSAVRLVAAAVVLLLLVDPLLVHSFGFALSVAACAGIVVLAGPIGEVIPGPRRLAHAMGVTIGAQLGVSPVLLQLTRAIPVVTVMANLLCGPVAGFVMGWGMIGGLLAGIGPRWFGELIHFPTTVGLWWISAVARWSAAAPLGHLGMSGLAILGVGLAVVVMLKRHGRPRVALSVATVVSAMVVIAPGGGVDYVPGEVDLMAGAVLWQAPGSDGSWGRVLVLDGRADPGRVLSGLRGLDVDQLDLVVVASDSRTAVDSVAMLSGRIDLGTIWVADDLHAVALGGVGGHGWGSGVVVVDSDDVATVGGLVVDVDRVVPKLDVTVSLAGVGSPDGVDPDTSGSGGPDL